MPGVIVPALVPQMPADLTSEERSFARHVLRDSVNLLDNPFQRLLTRRLRVVSVTPVGMEGTCGDLPFVSRGLYWARTQALTLFGLPMWALTVTCDGARLEGRR